MMGCASFCSPHVVVLLVLCRIISGLRQVDWIGGYARGVIVLMLLAAVSVVLLLLELVVGREGFW
jgi:hypothetical protein